MASLQENFLNHLIAKCCTEWWEKRFQIVQNILDMDRFFMRGMPKYVDNVNFKLRWQIS